MDDLPKDLSNAPTRLDREALRARKHDRESFLDLPRTPIVLVFDGVFGNYNQGAIFRLADAFMLEKLHFCGASVKPWHKRFLKSARGTHKWVPFTVGEDITAVIQAYSEQGYQVAIVEQCEGSVSMLEAQFNTPLCLVLGGELSGVSAEILELADLIIELPTLGMANSLNVSMSAGMVVMTAYQTYMKQLKG